MKFFIILTIVYFSSAAPFDANLDEHWENFKITFNKSYRSREEGARRLIWEQHVADIVSHNLQADMGIHSFRTGVNEYSDMTHLEFIKTFNGFKKSNATKLGIMFMEPLNINLPEQVDWRKEGMVTPVKNQQQCGSCWAFSTTGSLEGQHMKKTGNLMSLSEQNLVDCSTPEGNEGCNGGVVDQAFEYVKKNHGIDTEKSYPYTAEGGSCHYKKKFQGATCTGYVDIPSGDEIALQKALATVGPISVAIDASQPSFQQYKSGIYNERDCTENLDHGVLVVGYGTEGDDDYWLVKNSWGTTWGEKGYIRMTRNKDNQCGIASQASYPLM